MKKILLLVFCALSIPMMLLAQDDKWLLRGIEFISGRMAVLNYFGVNITNGF